MRFVCNILTVKMSSYKILVTLLVCLMSLNLSFCDKWNDNVTAKRFTDFVKNEKGRTILWGCLIMHLVR